MFHLKHPRFRGFFAWDELGCLARSLGFPVELFRSHIGVSEEVLAEDNGLPIKELIRMLDYKILFKALHLTQNHHTADWNTCVIRRCVSILDHKALSYESIYNARVAYQAYEAGDMKGMVVDQRVLMRTLKMCGKTISPMKLMHRVKHSRAMYDEPGRMQLYEFLDLLLWAHGYEKYIPDETYGHFEMEDELFKLTDFNKLLSHHDERLATTLDAQYLKDEWEFAAVKIGDKSKLKGEAVVCGDSREELAKNQKQTYRHLKSTVGNSQKSVYCTKNGFVRERPLTAPDLSMYRQTDEYGRKQSAHNAILDKFHRIIKCTEPKDKGSKVAVDMSDRPVLSDYKRCQTPKVVSNEELVDTDKRWENLMFDIETEEGRYEISMDTEMDYYIPGYKEKKEEQMNNRVKSAPTVKKKSHSPDRKGRYRDIVNGLAYPAPRLPPSHGKKCDARFRGWYGVRSQKGPHYILVSPYFHNSPKGQLFQRLAEMSNNEIKNIHGNFVYRKTKANDVDRRPVTAPAVLTMEEYQTARGRHSGHSHVSSSGYGSMEENIDRVDVTQYHPRKVTPENVETQVEKESAELETTNTGLERECLSPEVIDNNDIYESRESVETSMSDRIRLMSNEKQVGLNNDDRPRAKSAYTHRFEELQSRVDSVLINGDDGKRPRSKSATAGHVEGQWVEDIAPTPYMDHSKPKIVSVGSIGKIALLENISEARYWEELGVKVNEERNREKEESVSSGLDSGDEERPSHNIKERASSQNSKKKEKSDKNEEEVDILELILQQEKNRKKKQKLKAKADKFTSSKFKRSPRSTLAGSEMENATQDGSQSNRSRGNHSIIGKCTMQDNELDSNIKKVKVLVNQQPNIATSHRNSNKQSSDSQKLNLVENKTEENENNIQKLSQLSEVGICKRSSIKQGRGKYERLVKRMGEDISTRLTKRLLTASLDTRKTK